MFKNKKIKKALMSEMDAPPSFDEFCAQNGIVVERDRVEQKTPKRSKLGLVLKLSPIAVAAAVLAIVLPITLIPSSNKPSGDGQHAGSLAVHDVEITFEEFVSDRDISMFNPKYMFDEHTGFRKMYVDDKTDSTAGHIGYSVSTDVYGATVDGVPYVYGFTFTSARVNALSALDKSIFYGCDRSVSYGGVDYKYKVNVGLTAGMNVYYRVGKYEYYVTVEPLGTAAIANESYMEMFLRLAFDEVEGAERVTL